MLNLFKEPIYDLPQTKEELDSFVNLIVNVHNLPDTDDTYESIATLILHMNQSVSSSPLSFFANSVKKSMANKAAYDKLQEFAQKRKEAALAAQEAAKETANVVSIQNPGV